MATLKLFTQGSGASFGPSKYYTWRTPSWIQYLNPAQQVPFRAVPPGAKAVHGLATFSMLNPLNPAWYSSYTQARFGDSQSTSLGSRGLNQLWVAFGGTPTWTDQDLLELAWLMIPIPLGRFGTSAALTRTPTLGATFKAESFALQVLVARDVGPILKSLKWVSGRPGMAFLGRAMVKESTEAALKALWARGGLNRAGVKLFALVSIYVERVVSYHLVKELVPTASSKLLGEFLAGMNWDPRLEGLLKYFFADDAREAGEGLTQAGLPVFEDPASISRKILRALFYTPTRYGTVTLGEEQPMLPILRFLSTMFKVPLTDQDIQALNDILFKLARAIFGDLPP